MNLIKTAVIVFMITGIFGGKVYSQHPVTINIKSISSNYQITGNVIGLTEVARQNHKVVVFVKTDQWYIHPYAQGGIGKSWAKINSDGLWKISTVKREFPASLIAALVVKKTDKIPSTAKDLNIIPNTAKVVKELEGTSDFNKL